jgi:hypothetical protein
LFFSFVFLFSCTILSLRLDNIWIWSAGISAILLASGTWTKNAGVFLAAIIPLAAGFLVQSNLDSVSERQSSTAAIVREHRTLSGTVVDIGNVKK